MRLTLTPLLFQIAMPIYAYLEQNKKILGIVFSPRNYQDPVPGWFIHLLAWCRDSKPWLFIYCIAVLCYIWATVHPVKYKELCWTKFYCTRPGVCKIVCFYFSPPSYRVLWTCKMVGSSACPSSALLKDTLLENMLYF